MLNKLTRSTKSNNEGRRIENPSAHYVAPNNGSAGSNIDYLRVFGNHSIVQTKLRVGPADDKYEREADRIAEQIVRIPAPSLGNGVSGTGKDIQRKCSACEREDEEVLQRKPKPALAGTGSASFGNSMRLSGGSPLGPAERSFFEPRFGSDFSGVRVHAGTNANALSNRFAARAFTYGNNIVFADGEYRPDSPGGRRLLAHELTHVVQQSGGNKTGNAETRISRQANNVIQRTPGVDADDSWRELVTTELLPGIPDLDAEASEAMRRMRATASGADLVNTLWRMFCGSGQCRSNITVSFVEQLPTNATEASGFFEPNARNRPNYTVWIQSRQPRRPNQLSQSRGIDWPGGSPIDFHINISDNASIMANTLYHEMLHVWHIHARRRASHPTGHGDVMQGEIEPEFLTSLQRFGAEMETLERQIHAQAAQRQTQQPTPPPPSPPPATASPPVRQSQPPSPSIVGGSVYAQGGALGNTGMGAFGTGIIGADLILGNIASFNIGARGIYLSPDHLLLGGAIGFRLRETEDGFSTAGPVTNPLFFDIDLGILAEVPVSDMPLGGNVQFLLSPGFGQEIGREGPRFFWRVGGFVLISDEGGALGGGTAGGGARF